MNVILYPDLRLRITATPVIKLMPKKDSHCYAASADEGEYYLSDGGFSKGVVQNIDVHGLQPP